MQYQTAAAKQHRQTSRRRFKQVKRPALSCRHASVVSRRNRQRKYSLADIVEIYRYLDLFFLRRNGSRLSIGGVLLFFFVFLNFLLIAFGCNRGRQVFAKYDNVSAPTHRMIEARHIEPSSRRARVGACGEVKVLAI